MCVAIGRHLMPPQLLRKAVRSSTKGNAGAQMKSKLELPTSFLMSGGSLAHFGTHQCAILSPCLGNLDRLLLSPEPGLSRAPNCLSHPIACRLTPECSDRPQAIAAHLRAPDPRHGITHCLPGDELHLWRQAAQVREGLLRGAADGAAEGEVRPPPACRRHCRPPDAPLPIPRSPLPAALTLQLHTPHPAAGMRGKASDALWTPSYWCTSTATRMCCSSRSEAHSSSCLAAGCAQGRTVSCSAGPAAEGVAVGVGVWGEVDSAARGRGCCLSVSAACY